MQLINRDDMPLTFRGWVGAGTNIDVALARVKILNAITDWRVMEVETSRAHNAFRFKIETVTTITHKEGETRYKINKINCAKFKVKRNLPRIEYNINLNSCRI